MKFRFTWQQSSTSCGPLPGSILSAVCVLRVVLMKKVFGLLPLFDNLIPWLSLLDITQEAVVISIGVTLFTVTFLPFFNLLSSGMWSRLFDRATYLSLKTPFTLLPMVCSLLHSGWLFYLCRTMWVQHYWIGLQVLQVLPLLMLSGSTITESLFVLVNQQANQEQELTKEKRKIAQQLTKQWMYNAPLIVYFSSMIYIANACSSACDLELPYKAVIVTSSVVDVFNRMYTAKKIYDIGKHIDKSDRKEESTLVNCVGINNYSGKQYDEYRRLLCVPKHSVTLIGDGNELVFAELKNLIIN